MGRPKSDKPALTNAERKSKWREENRDKQRKKDRVRKAETRSKLSQEERDQLTARNKEYKRKSRENFKLVASRQKVQEQLLKDRNRKARKAQQNNSSPLNKSISDYSTPRVQKHREKLKMNFITPKEKRQSKSTRKDQSKTRQIATDFQSLSSPSKKVKVVKRLMAIQSPRSSKVLKEALDEDHNLSTVSNVLSSIKTERSKTVNTARRLLISQVVKDKSSNSYEARKLNTSTS